MSIPQRVLEALNFAKTSQLPQGTFSLTDISQAGVLTPVPEVLPQSDCMEIQQQVCLVRNMNILHYQQIIQGFVSQPMLLNQAWYPHDTAEAMHLKVFAGEQTPPGHPLVVRVSCFLRITELQALEAIWEPDNTIFQNHQWRDYLSNHELSDRGYLHICTNNGSHASLVPQHKSMTCAIVSYPSLGSYVWITYLSLLDTQTLQT